MISTSELETREARSCKIDFSSDISRNSNSSFSKTTAVNSCIRLWIDAFIPLQNSYSEKSLVLFLTVAGILPSKFPSTTFFPQWYVACFKSIVVCSICHFCAALAEINAMRLCLLFNKSSNMWKDPVNFLPNSHWISFGKHLAMCGERKSFGISIKSTHACQSWKLASSMNFWF